MRALFVMLVLSSLSGCLRENGGRPDSPVITEGKPKEGSKPVAATDPVLAKKMADYAKVIEALKPIAKPVACAKLETLLPKAPANYKAGTPHSEMIDTEPSVSGEESYPIRYNFVEGKYKNGDKTLTVQILDTGHNHSFYKWIPEAAELKGGTDEEYEKGLLIDGDFAMESYRKSSGRCELTVMIAGRFQIEIKADGVSPEFAHTILKSIDRKALAGLKK